MYTLEIYGDDIYEKEIIYINFVKDCTSNGAILVNVSQNRLLSFNYSKLLHCFLMLISVNVNLIQI